MMDELERWLNHVNDTDHGWWPFLFMRPEPDERITTARVAALAALYGLLPGFFVNAVVRITGEHADSLHPLFFPLAVTLAFFAVFRFTFAASWNRRAARMARRIDRS
jgi:hypothetical protein